MGAVSSHLNHKKSDKDLANDQRQKTSSSSCFEENVWQSDLSILASNVEASLRRVVREEVDSKFKQYLLSPEIGDQLLARPSLPRTQVQEEQPRFKLVFSKGISLPIFTRNKILDIEKKPLQILLVDINSNGDQVMPIPVKVELVVLNGDFPPRSCDSWTSQQFEDSIPKERGGKPPLLRGDLIVTLKGGSATIGDIEFSDNSSWTRSRKFKIGARVVPGTNLQELRVLEAMTEGFVVREHRMSSYKKNRALMFDDPSRVKKKKQGIMTQSILPTTQGVLMEQQNHSHVQPNEHLNKNDGEGCVLKHVKTSKIDNNLHHEVGNSHTVHQQGIMTESTLTQVDLMERQHLSHVQPNEHFKNNDDGEGSVSIGSQDLHAFLASLSPSRLETFNPGFEEDEFFPYSSQFNTINPGFSLDD